MAASLTYIFSEKQVNVVPAHIQASFESWSSQQNKLYSSPAEKVFRLGVYYSNVLKINAINFSDDFNAHINKFSDLSSAEFKIKHNGYRFSKAHLRTNVQHKTNIKANPTSWDWRTKHDLTPIRDQQQCGSCWAFSAIEALESAYVIQGEGPLTVLSPQQLIDCSQSFGNNGCEGGLMDQAFKYIESKGIESEKDYPYTDTDDRCKYDSTKVVKPTMKSYVDVPTKNGQALEDAIVITPISVAVDAESWQFYGGGIIKKFCGTQLDHGVVVVGYGTERNTDYWIIRNSWGPNWGEHGFLRILKSTKKGNGTCGVNIVPSYPLY